MSRELELWKLSPSQMNVYNNCPTAWHYNYVVGIRKRQRSQRHFEWGNYWHELMHVYYHLVREGHKPGSDFVVNAMHSRIRRDAEAAAKGMLENADNDAITIVHDVSKVLVRYLSNFSPSFEKDIEVIGVEQNLLVPVETSKGNKFLLNCITDLIYKTDKGILSVRDHKSGQANSWNARMIPLENQLLFNSAAYYLLTGEMPLRVEISFVNSYNYKTKVPTISEQFASLPYTHNEKTILNYIDNLYAFADKALADENPVKNYGKDCSKCQYNEICTQEIRGHDTSSLIKSQYEKVDRDYEVRLKHRNPAGESASESPPTDKKPFTLSFNV